MDELVDILDNQGMVTGQICMKSEAHSKGYWHPCVHIWLYTQQGQVLVQKRVDTKDTFPGCWDVSVAGHIGAGEDVVRSAQRELFEELGVSRKPVDFDFIGNYRSDIKHNDQLIDREYHHVFLVEFIEKKDQVVLQQEEVSESKFIDLSQLKAIWSKKNSTMHMVTYPMDYLEMVYDSIMQRIE